MKPSPPRRRKNNLSSETGTAGGAKCAPAVPSARDALSRRVFLLRTAPVVLAVAAPAVFSAFLGGCNSKPPTPEDGIEYVRTTWKPARDFKHIGEYFADGEITGGDLILRTDPKARDGMYFQIGLPARARRLDTGSRITLEYLDSAGGGKKRRVFAAPAFANNPFQEILLGLTGADWPDKPRKLLAWRVTIADPSGKVVAQRQSFLWSAEQKPPEPKPIEP